MYIKELMEWERLPIQENWIMVAARSWRKQESVRFKAFMEKKMPWKREAMLLPLT